MRRPIPIIIAILLALGAIEGVAYWWMHPKPADLGEPVLVYRPKLGQDRRAGRDVGSAVEIQGTAGSGLGTGNSQQKDALPSSSSASSPNQLSTLSPQPSTSITLTPLPEIYHQAAPMLRCSGGQVFHAQLDATLGLHLAFFEWDHTDTGSVLEAFRHMPEACMGSIGMTLISKEKPIRYQVGNESLVFDHTIFREPRQGGGLAALAPPVHAFRAVWVAGMADSNARQGIGGDEFDHLRTIRLKSALTRFRPTHARVIQGAVRGASNGDAAWQAFESAMLKDLAFQ